MSASRVQCNNAFMLTRGKKSEVNGNSVLNKDFLFLSLYFLI